MGLDMYLTTNSRVLAQKIADNDPYIKGDEFEYRWCVKNGEIGYWRKFSALHNWFVTKIQGGTDDGGTYEVDVDDLRNLYKDICESIETKDADKFPPVEGFFFNPADYMEYHWAQMKRTKTFLELLFSLIDEDGYAIGDEGWTLRFYYSSSW